MKKTGQHSGARRLAFLFVVLILLGSYVSWALFRPIKSLQATASQQLTIDTTPGKLNWPANAQAGVGIVDSKILQTNGQQKPAPMASTAKIITALMVLKKYPLQASASGPSITLTGNDISIYNAYVAQGGSVVPVQSGEQISERQMLEALMLPSANNIADSMAIWSYGSLTAYATAANSYLQQLGLKTTHVGSDASGLSPDSTSTAHDLVVLGMMAMQDPILAQIVGMTTASDIPYAGTVQNVNFLLGTHNIIGLKTGNSDHAGGVFVSASRVNINNRPVTIVTALVGAPDLYSAVQGSLPMIQSAQANFSNTRIISSGAVVGRYQQPWGGSIAATSQQDLILTAWNGDSVPVSVHLNAIGANSRAGDVVGTLRTSPTASNDAEAVPIILATTPTPPPLMWRLTHPF